MPITPNDVAAKRNENTVNKLCDLIDKRLQSSDSEPVEFVFHPGTGSQIEQTIVDTYTQAGWSVSLVCDGSEHKLVFGNVQASASCEEISDSQLAGVSEKITSTLNCLSMARKALLLDVVSSKTDQPSYISLIKKSCLNGLHINNEFDVVDYRGYDAESLISLDASSPINCLSGGMVSTGMMINELRGQEESLLVKLLTRAAIDERTIGTYAETIHKAVLDSMASLEDSELIAAKMWMNPFAYRRLLYLDHIRGHFEEPTQREVLMSGLYGHLYTMDIHLSPRVPEESIFILPPAQYVGVITLVDDLVEINSKATELRASVHEFQTLTDPQNVRRIAIRW